MYNKLNTPHIIFIHLFKYQIMLIYRKNFKTEKTLQACISLAFHPHSVSEELQYAELCVQKAAQYACCGTLITQHKEE